jgi:hypothetical protein
MEQTASGKISAAVLSPDERTVLEIADRGESMMPIGRWQSPVESLVAKGFLRRVDKFNNYITEAGREALGVEQDEADDQLLRALVKRGHATVTYQRAGEDIAKGLVALAKEASQATGDDQLVALRACAEAVTKRAAEILQNG